MRDIRFHSLKFRLEISVVPLIQRNLTLKLPVSSSHGLPCELFVLCLKTAACRVQWKGIHLVLGSQAWCRIDRIMLK